MTTIISQPEAFLKGPTFQHRLAEVCRGLPDIQPLADAKHRNILIPQMVGGELEFAMMGMIGQALRMRGAQVTGLLCDAFLPACVCRKVDHHESACTRWCHRNSGPFARTLGLPHRWHSEFITRREIEHCDSAAREVSPGKIPSFVFRGVHVGALVPQSVESYFRVGRCDLSDPAMLEQAYRFLASGMYLAIIAHRAFDELRIDKVVSDCGMQIDWGIFRAAAGHRGIPVDVINVGLKGNALKLEVDRPGQPTERVAGWRIWRDRPLTDDQNRKLDAYLARRDKVPYEFKGEQWQGRVSEPQRVRDMLGLPAQPRGKIFAMFPNVGFDAGKTKQAPAFEYAGDWVVETIRWFASRPEHTLVVKIHPGEHHREARDPMLSLLHENFDILPGNVKVIAPSTDITAQSLVKLADAALVYTSTVAAEAVGLGKPVVLVGGGRHAGHGVTLDVGGSADYFDLLDSVCAGRHKLASPGELGRRYAYAVFFRADIPINHFRMLDINIADLTMSDLSDLLPGRDPCMDVMCRGALCDDLYENPIQ